MKKLLTLLERDCTLSRDQLAAAVGMSREQVDAAIERMEEEKIIRGYQALVDWDQVQPEAVTALIQVNVTPQSIDGYDRIAERIYQYEEVESMYLMSGTYDMTVLITHFILKRYKEQHLTFRKKQEKEERFVFE